jgi:hypothetical protein
MTTLTYNYGETPAEVIRERCDIRFAQSGESVLRVYGTEFDRRDLLVVLDALGKAGDDTIREGDRVYEAMLERSYGTVMSITGHRAVVQFGGGCDIRDVNKLNKDRLKPRNLRIDILAALGIVEG